MRGFIIEIKNIFGLLKKSLIKGVLMKTLKISIYLEFTLGLQARY